MKMLNTINFDNAKRLTALAIALVFCVGMFAPMATADAPSAAPVTGAKMPVDEAMDAPQTEPPTILAAPEPDLPDTIIIQPNGTVGKDTYIWEIWPNDNYGNDANIFAGSWNAFGGIHSCIQFPLPSNPKTVKSATLSLYVIQNYNAPFNCSVHALNSSWDEGNSGTEAANWTYRTTGDMWATPGGDYSATPSAYMWEAPVDTWMNFNVTAIVNDWNSNVKINNGFILKGNNVAGANDLVEFASSDSADARFRPKLTISYAAEITTPVGSQVMQEDDAARVIPLSGIGSGTLEHVSDPATTNNLIPFWGSLYDTARYQSLYTPSQVGSEGIISRIGLLRSNPDDPATGQGYFQNLRILMAHTTLSNLTIGFDTNYQGYMVEVFPTQNCFVNSSNGDPWIYFNLNQNFTYDSQYNLLVDISWNGDGGTDVRLQAVDTGVFIHRAYQMDATAPAASNLGLVTKFLVDAADNAVIEVGTTSNFWPFAADDVDEMRCQMLYNHTYINQTGNIDKISFQANMGLEWSEMENFSIRFAYSANDTLGNVFEANRNAPWIEVLNRTVYNVSTVGSPEWIDIEFDSPFNYNGNSNLLVEIRWMGDLSGSPDGIRLARGNSAYNSRLCIDDYDAQTATDLGTIFYNTRFIFADSSSLTWSAASNMPSIFSAIVVNKNLIITPQANQHGLGSVTLTLTNSNGESTSQLIQVTINAVNDAPVLAPISPITCVEDIVYPLNIASLITDIDDPIANITVSTSSTFATVNGTIIRFLYPEGVAHENVTVTVRDRSGLEDSEILVVTVTQINDPPEFTTFPTTTTCDATVSKPLPLNPDDEETNDANLLIYTDSDYITVTAHTLHLLYPKGIGTETVTVYLVDEMTYGVQNNVSYTMTVTIIDHPEVTNHTPTGTLVPIVSPVQVTFDAEMNRTKAENAFSLKFGATELNGTFSWNAAGTVMTFTPPGYMAAGLYTVSIAASAEDIDGVRMLNAHTWNFTVAYADYDGDGMPDEWEIENGLDPIVNDAAGDLDDDGMPNLYESQNNLNPAVNDADADADGDGATNLEEYEAETDPNDPESAPSDFTWIILMLVLVAVIAVVLIVVMLARKKKPAPEYQEGNYPPPPPDQDPYYPPPEGQGEPLVEPGLDGEIPADQEPVQ